MSIHSMPDVPGVDIAELIAREEAGEGSLETQDNPTNEDYAELRRTDSIYFRVMGSKGKTRKRSKWNWSHQS